MTTTSEWAAFHGVPTDDCPPPVPDYSAPRARTAREVAVRTLILQGVVAVGCDVPPGPIIDWFHHQGVWDQVSPKERAFLLDPSPSEEAKGLAHWRQEAEWALLWAIHEVPALGLPTGFCDTKRLVDEIIPALGSDVSTFVDRARLRAPGALLAEDDRTYNLYCYAMLDRAAGKPLPDDLCLGVLYQRRYAFEWLDGPESWDDVVCDA